MASDDESAAAAAVLRVQLQQKEEQLQQLLEEQQKLRKTVNEAAAIETLKRMQIMRSPPFVELQQLCSQRDAQLVSQGLGFRA